MRRVRKEQHYQANHFGRQKFEFQRKKMLRSSRLSPNKLPYTWQAITANQPCTCSRERILTTRCRKAWQFLHM